MKFASFVILCALCCASFSGVSKAADISRLEWGSYVVEDDTSDGWSNYKFLSSDDGRTLTMTFAPLEAKADGATSESRSRLSGHYDVMQPKSDTYANCIVTVEGHVIKSGATVVRLVLDLGTSQNIIEWKSGETVSEKFTRKIEIAVPAEGRLPNPFKVGIEAYVRKEGPADAAYVSIDKLTITAANSQVAAN